MPSKDKKVVSAKISESEYQRIEMYANTHNISISAMITLCLNGLLNGDLDIQKGELKTGVDPIGYAVSDDLDTPFGQKVDRKLERLIERGYPENFIYSMKEQILNGLDAQIDMLPKRFDARKMKNNDCGC